MANRRNGAAAAGDHNLEDFIRELDDIHQGKEVKEGDSASQDDGTDDELAKTPEEGEQEVAWLNAAGFGHLAEKYEDGKELEDDLVKNETSSLTRAQAAAVKKRVDTLNATIRKKHKQNQKTDVRDVFSGGQEAGRRGSSDGASLTGSGKGSLRGNRSSGGINISKNRHSYSMTGDLSLQNPTTSGVEMISIQSKGDLNNASTAKSDFNYTSAAASSSVPGTVMDGEVQRMRESNYVLSNDNLGITHVCDLGRSDLSKLQPLALIELTSLFDVNSITYTRRKAKRRLKDHGVFGVSLQTLLDHDQKKYGAHIKVPRIVTKLVDHLVTHGIIEEGILRVPGSASRIKSLKQEINEKFRDDRIDWEEIRPNDAAGLLKQLIRELPVPLLTMEYYDAFAQVEAISGNKDQLHALNLLVLLLPDVHRDTLLLLLNFLRQVVDHEGNLMNLNNVAMIMAPNLFLVTSGNKNKLHKEVEIRMAAGTANIVKMLINYQHLLPIVPSIMVAQIRSQYERDQQKKSRDKLIMKFLGRKDKSEIYKKPMIQCESDYNKGVIRVQAPHLSDTLTSVELKPDMSASDVISIYFKKTHNTNAQNHNSSRSSGDNPTSPTSPHPPTMHLYEVGGNIGERRLHKDTRMLALLKANPNAEWVIRPSRET